MASSRLDLPIIAMPFTPYDRLIAQLRQDAARSAVTSPPERRVAFVDGFLGGNVLLRKQGCYPAVDLSVELREDINIVFTYQYRRTDTSEVKEWGSIIRCEIDAVGLATLSCGNQKFIDERELSKFLLRPLVDTKFTPPETTMD